MSSNGTGPMRIDGNQEPERLTSSGTEVAPVRLLRFPEVRRRTGLSRSTIWRLERRGEFPMHCRISSGAVGWVDSEIAAWLEQRIGTRSREPRTGIGD